MDSKNELLDGNPFPKEDELIPKIEPIDPDLIKKEKIEEEEEGCFAIPGIIDSLNFDKDLVKKEVIENNEIDSSSSSNVWNIFYMIKLLCNSN